MQEHVRGGGVSKNSQDSKRSIIPLELNEQNDEDVVQKRANGDDNRGGGAKRTRKVGGVRAMLATTQPPEGAVVRCICRMQLFFCPAWA